MDYIPRVPGDGMWNGGWKTRQEHENEKHIKGFSKIHQTPGEQVKIRLQQF